MNTIAKVAAVVGGIVVLSEVLGIIGEAQVFAALHHKSPDVVDETIEILENPEEYGTTNPYRKLKSKAIAHVAKTLIEV